MTTTNKYLWNYERITYTNNTTSDSAKRVIGVYGNTGATGPTGPAGEDGNGIKSITNYYLASTAASGVTTATAGWTTTVQTTTTTKKYLWNYEKIAYTNGTTVNTVPCIIGTHGETGPAGKGITSITEQYYLSTSKETPTGGSWVTTPPQWVAGKYIWTRSKIVYINPTSTEYTDPICDSSWEAVNDIEIGGRNLLLDSEDGYSLTGSDMSSVSSVSGNKLTILQTTSGNRYTWIQNKLTISPEEIGKNVGQSYSYSVDIRINGSFTNLYGYIDLRSGSSKSGVFRFVMPDNYKENEWFRVSGTSKVEELSTITTASLLLFAWDGATVGSTLEWRLHKFEKGNQATDWTPAPEENIETVDVEYYLSTSTTSLSGGTWQTVAPTWVNGKYMWSRMKTVYKDGTISYSEPTCIAGAKGDTGATGPKGDTGIIVSATAPASPVVGQLWQSAAGQPIKRWDGSKWVIHYLSVENLDVDVLSALSANLGTVTAGKIQNNNSAGYVIIDLATGEIKSYNDTDLATLLIKAGKFTMTGKDPNTILVELGISPEDGFSGVVSNKRISIQPSPASIDGTSTADFALTPEGKTGILMYQRLSNVPEKIYRASLVVNPGGNNYVLLFSNTQLKEMFGNDFVSNRLTGMVINGDADANSNRLAELQYYNTSGLWLYFWSSFSGPFRVNIKLEYG